MTVAFVTHPYCTASSLARRLLAFCAPACLGFAAAAHGEAQAVAGDAGTIEEVIVTARKTEENVQDIPMSVQVLSADVLEVTDPTHFFDLQYSVPGLVVNNLGHNGAGFSLRGIADQGGSSLSVATHVDGVYLGSSNLSLARMFDLERVEILKGPQGTLYGRNATGGSLNLITKEPEQEFSAALEAAYGTFNTGRAQGHVNLPVGRAALRLAFVASEGDGYIRNSVDERRFAEKGFHGLRAALRIPVSDRLLVNVMAQHSADDGAVGDLWLPRPDLLVDPGDIRLTTVTLPNPFLDTETDFINVNAEYEFGPATLYSVTGYARSEVNNIDDCAGIPILAGCIRSLLPGRHRQLSQELRLAAEYGKAVDWQVGLYAYDDDSSRDYYQFTPVLNPLPTTDSYTTSGETTFAVFLHAIWRLAGGWRLSGGLRLNREDQWLSTFGTGADDSPTPVVAERDWSNESWRVDFEYVVSDDVLAYAGVSTGFKSGGIAIRDGNIPDSYDPEHLTAYEAGLKSDWRNGRMTLNGAFFYYDFRDLQVSTATVTDNDLIFETDNAARAEIYGIDAEGIVRVGDRFTASGGVIWMPKREFVEYRNDETGDTLAGNDLTRAPEWTATFAIDGTLPLGGFGNASARLEYAWRSGYFYTTDNNPRFSQDSFGLLNLYLRVEPTDGRWYAFASGRNLGDADYFNQVFLQASPGYPDTWEAGFGILF